MTTELTIEKEANLRAQKKKILQLQKLKYLSGNFEITNGSVAAAGTDNRHFLFTQERRANWTGHSVMNEKRPSVECKKRQRIGERSTTNLGTVANCGKDSDLERRDTPRFSPVIGTHVLPGKERKSAEETVESYQLGGTKTDGVKISIVVDNEELERYTPSFASGSSEYHRKTTEIRKKAAERRRNVVSSSDRHSSLFNLPSNNDFLNVDDVQPRRSASLTELCCQPHDGADLDAKRATYTSHRRRSKSEDMKITAPYALAEVAPLVPRTSSLSSIYDSFLTTERQEINFEGFVLKQQRMLEDNLRRVERNLDNTFSILRRYVNTTNDLRSNKSQGQS